MIPDPESKPILRDHDTEKTQGTESKPNQDHVNKFKDKKHSHKSIYIYKVYIYIYKIICNN